MDKFGPNNPNLDTITQNFDLNNKILTNFNLIINNLTNVDPTKPKLEQFLTLKSKLGPQNQNLDLKKPI